MSILSQNLWRYYFSNHLRGFMHYEHSHARVVYSSLLSQIKNPNKDPTLDKVIKDLEYVKKTNDSYYTEAPKSLKEQEKTRAIFQRIDLNLSKFIPPSLGALIQTEEYLISRSMLDDAGKALEPLYTILDQEPNSKQKFGSD